MTICSAGTIAVASFISSTNVLSSAYDVYFEETNYEIRGYRHIDIFIKQHSSSLRLVICTVVKAIERIKRVFTAYKMLFISDDCRIHVGQVVTRDKLIIR